MKFKGIILAVILSLVSIMMPFSVYADGLIVVNGSDYLLGINVDLYDSSLETYTNQAFITSNNGTSNYSQYTQTNVINSVEVGTYKYTFVFNKSYVGRIVLQYVVPGSQTTRQFTLFVNGTTAEYYSTRDNRYTSTSTFINNWTLSSAQLVEHDDIESLEQIVDLLQDIYNDTTDLVGASASQLDELQNIVANTSLSNDYLKTISQIRQFNIPYESIAWNSYLLEQLGSNLLLRTFSQYYSYQLPVYQVKEGQKVFERYASSGQRFHLIFFTNSNINGHAQILNYYNVTGANASLYSQQFPISLSDGTPLKLVHIILQATSSNITMTYNYSTDDMFFIPIFFYIENVKYYVSTDFALIFGLSNSLLDDLNIIANGTTQSNSAASNLESGNDHMADDMNDFATIENGYNQQFNNQLQQIDFTSPLQNNAGILPAANFVITIFNGLINNNPFSVLIIVVCILLIGKKVIGK